MRQIIRLYFTLKPLKPRQWWYRLVHPIQKKFSTRCTASSRNIVAALRQPVVPLRALSVNHSYDPSAKEFQFLHLTKAFPENIEWDYRGHGALWAYNLNYFEWLYDDALPVAERLSSITHFVAVKDHPIGFDAYPASLRIVAWTRFLLRFDIKDECIFKSLYEDAEWLSRFPEYHLDGNHLWENAVALICAGIFFGNTRFYQRGKSLITDCIREQLFDDGGHREGSPMYHSLLLWRLMQCIEMMQTIGFPADDLRLQLEHAAQRMLGWMSNITFSDGSWPAINDSTIDIAPSTRALTDYAHTLSLQPQQVPLGDSGYRVIQSGNMELFIDAADIQPSFQPGHAHADTGTFCLHYNGLPVIVDNGISTYQEGILRDQQRGTDAHNTIVVGNKNSSDVWKSFRTGRRASVEKYCEAENRLEFAHNGYGHALCKRGFEWKENYLIISDQIIPINMAGTYYKLHFHPDIELQRLNEYAFSTGSLMIRFENVIDIRMMSYNFAAGFNYLREAPCLEVKLLESRCLTIISDQTAAGL